MLRARHISGLKSTSGLSGTRLAKYAGTRKCPPQQSANPAAGPESRGRRSFRWVSSRGRKRRLRCSPRRNGYTRGRTDAEASTVAHYLQDGPEASAIARVCAQRLYIAYARKCPRLCKQADARGSKVDTPRPSYWAHEACRRMERWITSLVDGGGGAGFSTDVSSTGGEIYSFNIVRCVRALLVWRIITIVFATKHSQIFEFPSA